MKSEIRDRVIAMASKADKSYAKSIISTLRHMKKSEQEIGKKVNMFWENEARAKGLLI